MSVPLAPIKPILRVEDICELLGIKRTKFYELRAEGWFGGEGPALIDVQPAIDRFPRYHGAPFAEWLSDRRQARLRREMLTELSA